IPHCLPAAAQVLSENQNILLSETLSLWYVPGGRRRDVTGVYKGTGSMQTCWEDLLLLTVVGCRP
ncbi:hypothetical protein KUCAC02_016924, partial [Chaenocephalus aceratus]